MENEIDFLKHSDKQIASLIKLRRKRLMLIAKELKRHFVGIDRQIDSIIKSITTFYCCPELLTRPVVICLWGCTGVGKTDLVRRLVKLLKFHDRFCEVEMMNKGLSSTYPWHTSIASILSSNPKIESGKPCILLLDEIQNFRTITEDGDELPEYKYRDIWTLLSDGKLPFHLEMDYLLQLLWELGEKEKKEKAKASKKNNPTTPRKLTSEEDDELVGVDDEDKSASEEDGEADNDPRHPHPTEVFRRSTAEELAQDENDDNDYDFDSGAGYFTLKKFKSILRLKNPIEEIATWDTAKKKALIIQRLNEQELYEEIDYTKALIFISGNIDEAYEFAKKSNEVDIDADIFNEMSQKINILDIKKALGSRFKPEQIARFGNQHIIYPTLSKASYEAIIERKIKGIVENVKNRCNIDIIVDKSINHLLYENGVYPTQGTRPIFSTISEIMEAPLPQFLLNAFYKQAKKITLSYDHGKIRAEIGKTMLNYPYSGALDKLRNRRSKNMDRRALMSVHEAGHAVVYASLFNSSPPQISAHTAANDVGGFIWTHETCASKEMMEYKACAMLAGKMAEKMVFGAQNLTSGASADIHEATKLVGGMVKRYGMEDFSSFIMHPQRSDVVNTDLNAANPIIEKIMTKLSIESEGILCDHIAIFNEVVDYLMTNKELSPKEFKKICATHGLKINTKKSEEVLYSDYNAQYQRFKKQIE